MRYRFFLNGTPVTDWIEESSWTWDPDQPGTSQIEVQVRDGEHEGPEGFDDRKAESFTITAPAQAMPQVQVPSAAAVQRPLQPRSMSHRL